ncbi:MAG: hypothetical protein ACPLIG_08890 [Candidatus Bathyarchaeales archaeon]
MTCYFRHLREVLQKAEIELTAQNKAELDKIIHRLVGVDYKNCPAAWKHVKAHLAKDEANFILKLREEWQKSGH